MIKQYELGKERVIESVNCVNQKIKTCKSNRLYLRQSLFDVILTQFAIDIRQDICTKSFQHYS